MAIVYPEQHKLDAQLCERAAEGDAEGVRRLLAQGARTYIRSKGSTALQCAIEAHCDRSVALLLNAGADPHQVNAEGRNAWDQAERLGYRSLMALLAPLAR